MMRYSLLFAGATLLAAPTTVLAQQVEIGAEGPVIELSVHETVSTEPDLVTIGAGVTSQARTAVEAMRLNARDMQRVIDQIKALGVDEKDIQTTGINLNAQYDYDRQNQRQVFRGYQVSNRVGVKLRDLKETGEVLDALVVAGATNLSGPTFSIEDDEAAKEAARESAVKRAQERAMAYAKLYGYDSVRILSISDALRGRVPSSQPRALAEDAIEVSAAPVQPGQVSTGVSLSIKYEMVSDNEKSAE